MVSKMGLGNGGGIIPGEGRISSLERPPPPPHSHNANHNMNNLFHVAGLCRNLLS